MSIRKHVLLIVFVSFSVLPSFCQRKFIPPKSDPFDRGWFIGGVLVKDKECLTDYLKTESLSGLDRRKSLTELIKFGCAEIVTAVYSASALETEKVEVGGKPRTYRHVYLVRQNELSFAAYGTDADKNISRTGWISESDFVRGPMDKAVLGAFLIRTERIRNERLNGP